MICGSKTMFSREDKIKFKHLQNKLHYKFRKIYFLSEALTHTSYSNENPNLNLKSNETLEFLGDSVLGLVITEYIYKEFPDYSEGKLSILKGNLVCESVLCEIAKDLELGDYLILGKGEDRGAIRTRKSVLSNILEAVIGAIYLDRGLKAAWKFVNRIYAERFKNIPETDILGSFKNRLQHYTQAKLGCMPYYQVVQEKGPSHNKTYEVTVSFSGDIHGRGMGSSKKQAEQEAAKEALIVLESEKKDIPGQQSFGEKNAHGVE